MCGIRGAQLLVLFGGAVMIQRHRHSLDDKGATNARELRLILEWCFAISRRNLLFSYTLKQKNHFRIEMIEELELLKLSYQLR